MQFFKEILTFVIRTRRWWLAPLLLLLLLAGLLAVFAESAVAPFIYSLF